MLRIRNPWGNSEWNGAWGSGSEELQKYGKDLEQYINSLPPDEQFPLEADDGTFFMEYSEWKDIFSTLFLNVDFPDEWTGVRFKSAWTASNSGGLPNSMKPEIRERYATNPQFFVKPIDDCEMMFAMSQTGGRLPQGNHYLKYPFKEALNFANIAVFRLPDDEEYLPRFEKQLVEYISPVKRERENAGRAKLKGGQAYVLIPACDAPGTEGELYLSIYLSCQLRDVSVKRIFHPLDKNTAQDAILPQLIPEEAEKISQRTPPWKLDLVRESLKYMITDEDAGAAGNPDLAASGSIDMRGMKSPFKRPKPKYIESD